MKTREGIGKREEDLAFAAVSGIPGTKAYRNVYIPLRGGRTAEIDILLVSAKGVVAIEVKGFGGAITGSAVRWEWTRTRREKRSGGIERLKFYNPSIRAMPICGRSRDTCASPWQAATDWSFSPTARCSRRCRRAPRRAPSCRPSTFAEPFCGGSGRMETASSPPMWRASRD